MEWSQGELKVGEGEFLNKVQVNGQMLQIFLKAFLAPQDALSQSEHTILVSEINLSIKLHPTHSDKQHDQSDQSSFLSDVIRPQANGTTRPVRDCFRRSWLPEKSYMTNRAKIDSQTPRPLTWLTRHSVVSRFCSPLNPKFPGWHRNWKTKMMILLILVEQGAHPREV